MRIASVRFVESIEFAGESLSLVVGQHCDSVRPARLEGDGAPVPVKDNQRADGLLVTRTVSARSVGGERHTEVVWVPWANVRSVRYAVEVAK